MSGAVPAEEAIVLWNNLFEVSPANEFVIIQTVSRLEKLRRTQPNNLMARVALLKGYTLLGKVEFAIDLADGIWNVRSLLAPSVAASFATLIYHLGMYERFLELAVDTSLDAALIERKQSQMKPIVFWRLGDLDKVRQCADSFVVNTIGRPDLNAFLLELERRGLNGHFGAHQRIIREETIRQQVASTVFGIKDESDQTEICTIIYTPDTYKDRVAREDRIRNRLHSYYAQRGLANSGYWQLMPATLLSHKAVSFGSEKAAA